MYKIISLERLDQETFTGFLLENGFYKQFIFENNTMNYLTEYSVSNYENRSHFINVMGKFNPSIVFFPRARSIEKLDLENFQVLNEKILQSRKVGEIQRSSIAWETLS